MLTTYYAHNILCSQHTMLTMILGKRVFGSDYRLDSMDMMYMCRPVNTSFSAMALDSAGKYFWKNQILLQMESVENVEPPRGWLFSWVALGRVQQKLAAVAGNISQCCELRLGWWYSDEKQTVTFTRCSLRVHCNTSLHDCKYALNTWAHNN